MRKIIIMISMLSMLLSLFFIIQNKESYGSSSETYCHVKKHDLTWYGDFTNAECRALGGVLGKIWDANRRPFYFCGIPELEKLVYFGRSWSYENLKRACSQQGGILKKNQ